MTLKLSDYINIANNLDLTRLNTFILRETVLIFHSMQQIHTQPIVQTWVPTCDKSGFKKRSSLSKSNLDILSFAGRLNQLERGSSLILTDTTAPPWLTDRPPTPPTLPPLAVPPTVDRRVPQPIEQRLTAAC
jgi:hypothetical protein